MTYSNRMLVGWAASIAIGLAAGGAAIGAGNGSSDGPISCEIAQSRSGSMIMLESIVTSARSATGQYAFSARGAGTNIKQGGDFEAGPGEAVTLGSIMLGASGGYDVRLDVSADGHKVTCSQRIGSI